MAYENYLQKKINHTWPTQQCCLNQIVKNNGGNDYNIEHVFKEKLECIGELPDVMEVVVEAQQLFNTSKAQMMSKHTSYPHKSGRMGAMANDYLLGVGLTSCFCCCCVASVFFCIGVCFLK